VFFWFWLFRILILLLLIARLRFSLDLFIFDLPSQELFTLVQLVFGIHFHQSVLSFRRINCSLPFLSLLTIVGFFDVDLDERGDFHGIRATLLAAVDYINHLSLKIGRDSTIPVFAPFSVGSEFGNVGRIATHPFSDGFFVFLDDYTFALSVFAHFGVDGLKVEIFLVAHQFGCRHLKINVVLADHFLEFTVLAHK